MSYYERHVFFCCNQRDGARTCCNDKGASAIRDIDEIIEEHLRQGRIVGRLRI